MYMLISKSFHTTFSIFGPGGCHTGSHQWQQCITAAENQVKWKARVFFLSFVAALIDAYTRMYVVCIDEHCPFLSIAKRMNEKKYIPSSNGNELRGKSGADISFVFKVKNLYVFISNRIRNEWHETTAYSLVFSVDISLLRCELDGKIINMEICVLQQIHMSIFRSIFHVLMRIQTTIRDALDTC